MSKKNTILNIKKDKAKILKEVEERIKLNKRIEIACRNLCLHNGIDPDKIVCKQMPEYIAYPIPAFFLPNPQYTMPAWWLYRDIVEQTLNILEITADA